MVPTKLGVLLRGVAVTQHPDIEITDVVIDSRLCGPGKLYIAIKGERFDGNDFARDALAAGAAAVVVSRRCDADGEQIVVSDTRRAYVEMAANYRELFSVTAVGITGSVGKTTTKEMTGAMLRRFGSTLVTSGNRNNEIGLPETLFRLGRDDRFAAVEIALLEAPGGIEMLSKAVRPKVGVITCVGTSHMEFFGTRENILKGKLEIVCGMPQDGVLVVNSDDEFLTNGLGDIEMETATFGIDNVDADVCAKNISMDGLSSRFTLCDRHSGSFAAHVPAIGRHTVLDALAAYTAVTRIGLDPATAVAALLDYKPAGMRQRIVDHNGITVIEDCYNASPDSMRASLRILSDVVSSGIKIAVLGDMLELGEASVPLHKEIGREVAKCGIDILLCCGPLSEYMAQAAQAAKVPCVEHFDDKHALAAYLKKTARQGDGVLFKASRALEFEKIIEEFYK